MIFFRASAMLIALIATFIAIVAFSIGELSIAQLIISVAASTFIGFVASTDL